METSYCRALELEQAHDGDASDSRRATYSIAFGERVVTYRMRDESRR